MYFSVCDTVKSMKNKSKQDMLVKWNKDLYMELILSCQAYSPERGNTSWEVVCFCSEDEMWLARNQFKAAGLFWVTRTQMFHLETLYGTDKERK